VKVVKTVVVFDRGNVTHGSEGWATAHEAYTNVIGEMTNPPSSKSFKLRSKCWDGKEWQRNGVKPIKKQFLERMKAAKWRSEEPLSLDEEIAKATGREPWITYPERTPLTEVLHAGVGGLDFWVKSREERIGIEWETGNISSSHRSMNKLCLSLMYGLLDACVLIVPSRLMYEHLTDRIGNWKELSPYLTLWKHAGSGVKRGLLAVTIVEHDSLNEMIPYIGRGRDGRSAEGKRKLGKER